MDTELFLRIVSGFTLTRRLEELWLKREDKTAQQLINEIREAGKDVSDELLGRVIHSLEKARIVENQNKHPWTTYFKMPNSLILMRSTEDRIRTSETYYFYELNKRIFAVRSNYGNLIEILWSQPKEAGTDPQPMLTISKIVDEEGYDPLVGHIRVADEIDFLNSRLGAGSELFMGEIIKSRTQEIGVRPEHGRGSRGSRAIATRTEFYLAEGIERHVLPKPISGWSRLGYKLRHLFK